MTHPITVRAARWSTPPDAFAPARDFFAAAGFDKAAAAALAFSAAAFRSARAFAAAAFAFCSNWPERLCACWCFRSATALSFDHRRNGDGNYLPIPTDILMHRKPTRTHDGAIVSPAMLQKHHTTTLCTCDSDDEPQSGDRRRYFMLPTTRRLVLYTLSRRGVPQNKVERPYPRTYLNPNGARC